MGSKTRLLRYHGGLYLKEKRMQLRRAILSKRSQLNSPQRQQASQLIAKQLFKSLHFLRSKRLAFYFANKGEVDTSLIVEKALLLGKECFFPVLHPIKHNRMWFGRYRLGDKLKKNYFGIPEPNLTSAEKVQPWSLDLVITPLVAFDLNGNRLGMGGGFYDRTFSFKSEKRIKPFLIGLAYDFQQINFLLKSGMLP